MRNTGTLSMILAAGAAHLVALPAHAGTRASDGRPRDMPLVPASGNPGTTMPKANVGPAQGFPDTPGLERARDRANGNAAFNRYKSNGAA